MTVGELITLLEEVDPKTTVLISNLDDAGVMGLEMVGRSVACNSAEFPHWRFTRENSQPVVVLCSMDLPHLLEPKEDLYVDDQS